MWLGAYSGDLQPGLRRGEQRDRAGMTDLEGGGRILRDEGLLHRDGHRPLHRDHLRQRAVQGEKAPAQALGGAG